MTVHPGEILREKLAEMGLSGSAAADRMGVTQPRIAAILTGRKGVGPVTALKLEELTGMSADLWAALQARYDVDVERNRRSQKSGRSKVTPRTG